MATADQTTKLTATKLAELPDDGKRYELIRGVLNMMSPAGSEHGRIAGRIFLRLADHVEKNELGETYAAETGFLIEQDPDTVRAPDAAFVSFERLAKVEPTTGYLPVSPNLVVEVVSPNDSFSEVEAKAANWLSAGTQIVLVADPKNHALHIHETDRAICVLKPGDTFSAGEVCGDWQLRVNDAFQIR